MATKHRFIIEIKKCTVCDDVWWAYFETSFMQYFGGNHIATMRLTKQERAKYKRIAADSNGRIVVREEK